MIVKNSKYRKLRRLFIFISLNLLFSFIVIWVAYSNRVKIKRWMDHDNNFSKEDKVIMYDIFSSSLVNKQNDLLFPAVKNSDELISDIINSTLPDSLDVLSMYNNCKVIAVENYRGDLLRVRYSLYNDTLESYSYFSKANIGSRQSSKAILYTAGSGENKPHKVAYRMLDIEDPIAQAEQIKADIFIPIFPADDILAIHDGTKMLDIKKVVSYLVSINRNIPLRYIANIFALEKYLRSNYSVLHSWGHSRGSITATLTASIFHPDTLIANSGYAVSLEKFFRLGPDQMWWPHAFAYLNKDSIKSRLCGQKTKTFFLYGSDETEDIYGLETSQHYTANFFKDCPNIKVSYTEKKHVWSPEDISKVLSGK
jgi:hypothetical protein